MPRAATQPTLFDLAAELPDGFRYEPDFVSLEEERELLARLNTLRFDDVRMHGVIARRRIVQYGRNYSFDSARVSAGTVVPDFLEPLRTRVAGFAGRARDEFSEVLITQYPAGAPIGWHRDAPPFDIIAGVSLVSTCRFQLRRYDRTGDVLSLDIEPRSIYLLAGAARTDWEHHIPPTRALRYSITMRTLRRSSKQYK